MRRRTKLAAAVCGGLAALGAIALATAAGVTRSATVAVPVDAKTTASAHCPKGKGVVLGGFRTDRTDSGEYPVTLTALKRSSARTWGASAANWNATTGATQTAIAYCGGARGIVQRARTVKVKSLKEGGATAKCPRGTRIAFGGVKADFDVNAINSMIFVDGLRKTSDRTWRASGYNLGDVGGKLTAIAYCGHAPKTTTTTRTVVVGGNSSEASVTAHCQPKHPLVFGGFKTDVTAFSSFVLIEGLERASAGAWKASAKAASAEGEIPAPDGNLTVIAYCRR